MKKFTSVNDVKNIGELLAEVKLIKSDPHKFSDIGRNKTLGLIFMNPSFRTRLSTQKAAHALGMHVMVLNINQEGWKLEMEDGAVMNGQSAEHIKDAAAIMGTYCDIVGLRCFPELVSREDDYSEKILENFIRYCKCPFISLESATLHPLQSLTDIFTIRENWHQAKKPKVVLTWAPHIKPLPQAVPNSFSEWASSMTDMDFVACFPEGYELHKDFTRGAVITHKQEEALEQADFVYIKNWSSYAHYGTMPEVKGDWLMNDQKLALTNNARIMHCLPVRRNVEVPDHLLDSDNSLILQQAENRVFAAQAVFKQLLEYAW